MKLHEISYDNYKTVLSEDEFNFLNQTDPTPNKKYVKWLINLKRSDPPAYVSIIKDEAPPLEITAYLRLFDIAKIANVLPPEIGNDIFKIKTLKEFRDLCSTLRDIPEVSNKLLSKESTTLFNNENWKLVQGLSWEACNVLGSGSRWCVSNSENPYYFNDYQSKGKDLYFLKNKETGHRYLYCTDNHNYFEIKDSKNNEFDTYGLWIQFPIELQKVFLKLGFNTPEPGANIRNIDLPRVYNTDTHAVESLDYPSDLEDRMEDYLSDNYNSIQHRHDLSQSDINWWKAMDDIASDALEVKETFFDTNFPLNKLFNDRDDNYDRDDSYAECERQFDNWKEELPEKENWNDLEDGYLSMRRIYSSALVWIKDLKNTIASLFEEHEDIMEDKNAEVMEIIADSISWGDDDCLQDIKDNVTNYIKKYKEHQLGID